MLKILATPGSLTNCVGIGGELKNLMPRQPVSSKQPFKKEPSEKKPSLILNFYFIILTCLKSDK